jgi:hypothetical protein
MNQKISEAVSPYPYINDTTLFHRHEMDTLGWELTVCNTLEPEHSPARQVLARQKSFGELLYDFLAEKLPMSGVRTILEVGGGYGYIMRDFLRRRPDMDATMLDLSPYLLDIQKKTLGEHRVRFIEKDFLAATPDFLSGFDMAVLNENIGDFPTACGVTPGMLAGHGQSYHTGEIRRFIDQYGLDVPDGEFNFNLGALRAVELLCSAGVPYIYLSEHSCETDAPEPYRQALGITPGINPERIALKGHDEYTIRFSHVEALARGRGYDVIRGNYTHIVPLAWDSRIHFILTAKTEKDEHEIIRLFIGDLYKYEYLVLIRN